MKLYRKLLVLILAMGALAACSNKKAAQDTDGITRLKMWVHVTDETDEGKTYASRVDAFNESHPNIKVSLEFIPRGGGGSGYEDKVNTALTTNQLPDIITLDGPNTAAYADAKIIVPIGDYITDESKQDYVDSILQQGTYNGNLYSLGIMESSVALFYNKDILAKYGSQPGTIAQPWTWDDLYAFASKFTKATGKPALDMALNWTGEWKIYAYAPLLWSNGGDVIGADGLDANGTLNSPNTLEAFEFLHKLVKEGIVSPTPEDKTFMIGNTPLLLQGAWSIADLQKNYPDLNWGVMPYPVSPKTKKLQVPTGSWAFAVTTAAKNVQAAAEVVEWMTNKDSTIEVYNAIKMLPNRISAAKEIPDFSAEGPSQVFMDQLIVGGHARPRSVVYPLISRSFEEIIDSVIYGTDIKQALDEKVTLIERETRRFRK